MSRPNDWNELDDAYLEIFGTHPDLVATADTGAIQDGAPDSRHDRALLTA